MWLLLLLVLIKSSFIQFNSSLCIPDPICPTLPWSHLEILKTSNSRTWPDQARLSEIFKSVSDITFKVLRMAYSSLHNAFLLATTGKYYFLPQFWNIFAGMCEKWSLSLTCQTGANKNISPVTSSPHTARNLSNILISRLPGLLPLPTAGGGHQPRARGPGVRDVGNEGLEAAVVLRVVDGGWGGGGGGEVHEVLVRRRLGSVPETEHRSLVCRSRPPTSRRWSHVGELLAWSKQVVKWWCAVLGLNTNFIPWDQPGRDVMWVRLLFTAPELVWAHHQSPLCLLPAGRQ